MNNKKKMHIIVIILMQKKIREIVIYVRTNEAICFIALQRNGQTVKEILIQRLLRGNTLKQMQQT